MYKYCYSNKGAIYAKGLFSLFRRPSPTCPADRLPLSREKVNQGPKLYILNEEIIRNLYSKEI